MASEVTVEDLRILNGARGHAKAKWNSCSRPHRKGTMAERGQAIMTSGDILEASRLAGSSLVTLGTLAKDPRHSKALEAVFTLCTRAAWKRGGSRQGVTSTSGTKSEPAAVISMAGKPPIWLK